MSFTGKSTYSAGTTLPEIAEDVSDIVAIVSPYETPLLDLLGDARLAATSTKHEWLEDTLNPNTDTINQSGISDGSANLTSVVVAHISRFIILGNAALEGDTAPTPLFTTRTRMSNYTQIFSSAIQISGSDLAVRQLAIADELGYQKQARLRELLRDLENCVISGQAPSSTPQGSSTVRRTMKGIIPSIATNIFTVGANGFPSSTTLTEAQLNLALRNVWSNASSKIDTIVVGGAQKRQINSFVAATQRYAPNTATNFQNLVNTYESDFGVCRVILSRWVPADAVLLLDSSRINVLPLIGRSFAYKPLAPTGDYIAGELLGEYTLEFKNESAHAIIRGLATS
jgi:hypothetical protein